MRLTPRERFLTKVKYCPSGCWEWLGNTTPEGYGRFWYNGRKGHAHRFAYETFKGSIPDGLELDHLCRKRRCVNPNHLEAVTRSENARRGLPGIKGTYCKRGHLMESNSYIRPDGSRECRLCHNARSYRFIRKHKERYAAYQREYRQNNKEVSNGEDIHLR